MCLYYLLEAGNIFFITKGVLGNNLTYLLMEFGLVENAIWVLMHSTTFYTLNHLTTGECWLLIEGIKDTYLHMKGCVAPQNINFSFSSRMFHDLK